MAPAQSFAQSSNIDPASSPISITYGDAEIRLRSASGLTRAAGYGLEAATAQESAASRLNRPTISLDAQIIRYRKTFDLSLADTLERARNDLGAAIPGLLSDIPGLSGDILDTVNQRLQAALPEIFTALPTDIRLQVEDTAGCPTITALQPLYTGGAIPALQRAAAANVDLAEARILEVRNCPSSKHLAQVWRGVNGERASSGVGF